MLMSDTRAPTALGLATHTTRAHHGEIVQGVFEHAGRLRRALVTLPCPLYATTATFAVAESPGVDVLPAWRTKARRAARLTLDALGRPDLGGRLDLSSTVPLGHGFGSSTTDVTAAINAVAAALGRRLPRATVASLAVQAEVASDSLMYEDRVVLFAHREGAVLEDLGADLPPMTVLGFRTSSGEGGVDTLDLVPARYSSHEIEALRPVLGILRHAVRHRDVELLGRAATTSARINQRHLPVPMFPELEALARRARAAGIQVAHSGDIAGLIFDARAADLRDRLAAAAALLTDLGIARTWCFGTDRTAARTSASPLPS